jgi:hypothetical protein
MKVKSVATPHGIKNQKEKEETKMLTFKSYLNEQKEKKKDVETNYNKVFIGKIGKFDEDDDAKSIYHKVFIGKVKKIDEAFRQGAARHEGPRFDETQSLHQKLSRRYKFGRKLVKSKGFEPDLNDPDGDKKTAIRKYSGIMYKKINKSLYTGDSSELTPQHQSVIDNLKSALVKHKTGEDMTVSSGIKVSPDTFRKKGDEGPIKMTMPAFTSTSLAVHVARDFAKPIWKEGDGEEHMIHIDVPKGSHGAYVAHHSAIPEEHEFILHPGARLHVDPLPSHISERTNSDGDKIRTHHWNARLVHDGVKDV